MISVPRSEQSECPMKKKSKFLLSSFLKEYYFCVVTEKKKRYDYMKIYIILGLSCALQQENNNSTVFEVGTLEKIIPQQFKFKRVLEAKF
jgi:hypothetical protein